jgi:hypothetical protein
LDERIARVESSVDELRLLVQSLQRRLDALETRGSLGTDIDARAGTEAVVADKGKDRAEEATAKDPYDPIAILTLIGRLFLVLAGGFFLRAMTDTGVIAPPIGLGLAFTYALAWLYMTDRAADRRQVPSALFHALAAAMVAFPLLVEATMKFKVLSATTSAMGIALVSAVMLVVAWRQRMSAVAWLAVAAAVPTSFALLIQTGVVVPFAFFLIAFGLTTLWLSEWLDWRGVPWPTALAADIAVVGVTLRALAPEHQDSPETAMLLQSLLLGGYVISAGIRTLLRDQRATYFEMAQTAAALVVGLGGAVFLTRTTGTIPVALGVASIAFGAGCYGAVVRFIEKREDGAWNAYFYSSLALVLVMTGFMLVLGDPWPAIIFAVLGALAAWLWARGNRRFTILHGGVYLVAAGVVSGTLAYSVGALAFTPAGPWALPSGAMVAVMIAAGLSSWLVTTRPQSDRELFDSVLRFVIVLVFVGSAGACVIGYLAPLAGGLADGTVDPGVLATVRTSVLSLATLLLAWLGRSARFREWGWLVYPLLIGIGAKMVAQDFQASRPATLFIAMALYGAALIVAPRLRRRGEKHATQPGN